MESGQGITIPLSEYGHDTNTVIPQLQMEENTSPILTEVVEKIEHLVQWLRKLRSEFVRDQYSARVRGVQGLRRTMDAVQYRGKDENVILNEVLAFSKTQLEPALEHIMRVVVDAAKKDLSDEASDVTLHIAKYHASLQVEDYHTRYPFWKTKMLNGDSSSFANYMVDWFMLSQPLMFAPRIRRTDCSSRKFAEHQRREVHTVMCYQQKLPGTKLVYRCLTNMYNAARRMRHVFETHKLKLTPLLLSSTPLPNSAESQLQQKDIANETLLVSQMSAVSL